MGKKNKRVTPLKSRPVYEPGVAESLGIVSVTRIEALVRVLDTAIWMWAVEKDPLAIHVLVMSQYQCLQDLGKKNGVTALAATLTEPTQRTLVYDFLRHANRNAFGGVDFTPILNFGFLFDAICTFEEMFGGCTPLMKAFLAYFALWLPRNYPHLGGVGLYELPKGFTVANFHSDFRSLTRKALFAKLTKAFRSDAADKVDFNKESP
jgi:hypothetical protein